MSNVALIDGDIFCYRLAAAAQEEIDWDGDGEATTNLSQEQARDTAFKLVKTWTKMAKCKRTLLVFSDRSNEKASFRFNVHPHYKANRTAERPMLHDYVKTCLENEFPNKFLPGLEGDDTMGIIATGEDGLKYTMVTMDKDMLTVPGRICWLRSKPAPMGAKAEDHWKIERMGRIQPDEADYHWMFQTVMGDSVDNFKGAPGIGAKKAETFISRFAGLEKNIDGALAAFRASTKLSRYHDLWVHEAAINQKDPAVIADAIYQEFLMNARCARILRAGEYAIHSGSTGRTPMVKLWHPEAPKETWELVT